APGFCGMPDSGHCSSATMSASCARSSATSRSRTTRASPPISRADSMRQTVSMALRVSSVEPAIVGLLLTPLHLLAQPFVTSSELGRVLRPEVFSVEDLPEFDLRAPVERSALEPLHGFIHRLHLPEPVARHQLFGLRERSVDDRPLLALEPHALALRGGMQTVASEHDPRLHQLLVVVAHLGQQRLGGHFTGFALLA